VVVWDQANGREIVLQANHLEFGPTGIAAIYKDRWKIEVFFKTLKQHLKIKTFVGTRENALQFQIWTVPFLVWSGRRKRLPFLNNFYPLRESAMQSAFREIRSRPKDDHGLIIQPR
jgi:IS4 transposase